MSEVQVVVYSPPTDGLPFSVVTIKPDGGVTAEPFQSHGQALDRYLKAAAEAHGSSTLKDRPEKG